MNPSVVIHYTLHLLKQSTTLILYLQTQVIYYFSSGDAIGLLLIYYWHVTVTNTGVARLIAGTGVTLSGTTGNIQSLLMVGRWCGWNCTSIAVSTDSSRLTVQEAL